MVFVGEGKALAGLVDRAGVLSERSIRFFPHQPIGLAKELIRNADMGVVSLMSEIIRYAYPSKMMTYLEEGKPVCVSITEDCELSNFVLSNGIGICVPQNDPALIANAIQNLTNSSQCFKMSANVGLLDRTAFDKEVVLDQWSNLISGLTQSVSIK
jgi:glycosyltransferase involved in cell wall biosynthesis